MGANLPFVNLGQGRKAVAIGANGDRSCALFEDYSLKCWGTNDDGQLGQGDTLQRGDTPETMGDALQPIHLGNQRTVVSFSVGGDGACAILDNRQLKCWGGNGSGQLGLGSNVKNVGTNPGEMGDNLLSVDLGTGRYAVEVSAGDVHTCAILDNATVKCWGDNSEGQLGLGDTRARGLVPGDMGDALPAIDLGTTLLPVHIFTGYKDTCVEFEDHSLKCWGGNVRGILGSSDTQRGENPGEMGSALPFMNIEPSLPIAQVSFAYNHACVTFITGALKCWGANDTGQLGLEDHDDRGTSAVQMGSGLPLVNIGTFQSPQAVTVGEFDTCVILGDGSVKCWGENDDGELGLEGVYEVGGRPGTMGDALPTLSLF
jgi:alpha-tubulin suppressor-like RCC1 family protein